MLVLGAVVETMHGHAISYNLSYSVTEYLDKHSRQSNPAFNPSLGGPDKNEVVLLT